MNIDNVLRIELTNQEEKLLTGAIELLENLEKTLYSRTGYEFTKDLYHETRCNLLRVKNDRMIADSSEYHITKKPIEPTEEEKKAKDDYIKHLGKMLYKFADDTESLYDPERDEKPSLKEFSKALYSYKETAYLMESLLQGMDNSDDEFPRYYEVMMDLIHHMEWNDLESGNRENIG